MSQDQPTGPRRLPGRLAQSVVNTASRSGTRQLQSDPTAALTRLGPLQRVRKGLGVVTPAGWVTAVIAVVSWLVGWRFGWLEFMWIATAAAVCLLISIGFVFGSTNLKVEVKVVPQRVVAGRRSAGQLLVTNPGSLRALPSRMELVVGSGVAEFEIPSLGSGEQHEELLVLPTERRGVIPVGPATSVRGDPLGLLRRAVPWTEPIPLFVHPRTTALGHLGAGFLRDLEGQPTADLSPSDIAFHALRDYQPGDDRRFVHWMSTARAGKLMVRQFTDTRRAHLAVVVDGDRRSYRDGAEEVSEEFELAVEIAGSLGVRALTDEHDLTMMVAGHVVPCASGATMLDGLAAAQLRRRGSLVGDVERLNRSASGISLAIIVAGGATTIADLRAAANRFSIDVRTVVVRVDPQGETGFRPLGSTLMLTVSSLDELAKLLWAVTQ